MVIPAQCGTFISPTIPSGSSVTHGAAMSDVSDDESECAVQWPAFLQACQKDDGDIILAELREVALAAGEAVPCRDSIVCGPAAAACLQDATPKSTTLLIAALEQGALDVVRTLLAIGEDVNGTNGRGRTPLYVAALGKDVSIVQVLLGAGADVNAATSPRAQHWLYGTFPLSTPLHAAAMGRWDTPDIVQALLHAGADAEARMVERRTCPSTRLTPLMCALGCGHFESANTLLDSGCDPCAINQYITSLVHAADGGRCDTLTRIVQAVARRAGEAPPTPDSPAGPCTLCAINTILFGKRMPVQRTALFAALAGGHVDAALLLLAWGADPNVTPWPDTSLGLAVQHAPGAVLALIQAGFDARLLKEVHMHDMRRHPLAVAAARGDVYTCTVLLTHGVPADDMAWVAMVHAAVANHSHCVSVMAAHAVSVCTLGANGASALHAACIHGHAEVVRVLLSCGADDVIDAVCEEGHTALYKACEKGHVDCVRALLDSTRLAMRPAGAACPLAAACRSGSAECVRLLLGRGAAPDAADACPLIEACICEKESVACALIEGGVSVHRRNEFLDAALHWAAKKELTCTMRALLEAGADVCARDEGVSTPLHIAASAGSCSGVPLLLDAGADVHAVTCTGATPLHIACGHGGVDGVRALLAAGARVEPLDYGMCTPLMVACRRGADDTVRALMAAAPAAALGPAHLAHECLCDAIDYGWSDIVRHMLAAGAPAVVPPLSTRVLAAAITRVDLDTIVALVDATAAASVLPHKWGAAVHMCCKHGRSDVLRHLLRVGASVTAHDPLPLDAACAAGHEDVVRCLLDTGTPAADMCADPHATLLRAMCTCSSIPQMLMDAGADMCATLPATQLHLLKVAVWEDGAAIVARLLDAGVPVDTPDVPDTVRGMLHLIPHNPGLMAVLSERGVDAGSCGPRSDGCMHTAVQRGCSAAVQWLAQAGVSPNARSGGCTPLMCVPQVPVYHSPDTHIEITRALLAAGADPAATDIQGKCVLAYFAGREVLVDPMRMLIEAGARVDGGSGEGGTCLHIAASRGCGRTAAMLLDAGADVNARDSAGRTPLHVAVEHRHVVAALLQHGADPTAADHDGRTVTHGMSMMDSSMPQLLRAGALKGRVMRLDRWTNGSCDKRAWIDAAACVLAHAGNAVPVAEWVAALHRFVVHGDVDHVRSAVCGRDRRCVAAHAGFSSARRLAVQLGKADVTACFAAERWDSHRRGELVLFRRRARMH